jgi:hypothetical protein
MFAQVSERDAKTGQSRRAWKKIIYIRGDKCRAVLQIRQNNLASGHCGHVCTENGRSIASPPLETLSSISRESLNSAKFRGIRNKSSKKKKSARVGQKLKYADKECRGAKERLVPTRVTPYHLLIRLTKLFKRGALRCCSLANDWRPHRPGAYGVTNSPSLISTGRNGSRGTLGAARVSR